MPKKDLILEAFYTYLEKNDLQPQSEEEFMEVLNTFASNFEQDFKNEIEAIHLLDQAIDCDNPQQSIDLAHQALEKNPNLLDAKLYLAQVEHPTWESVDILQQLALEHMELLKKAGLDTPVGEYGKQPETDAYLNILFSLVQVYIELDWKKKAIEVLERMMELDVEDTFEIRYHLMGLYIELEQTKKLYSLVKKTDANTIPGHLFKTLMLYKEGKLGQAQDCFQQLKDTIQDWEEMDDERIEEILDIISIQPYDPGTLQECIHFISRFPHLFMDEIFLSWINKQLPENTLNLH